MTVTGPSTIASGTTFTFPAAVADVIDDPVTVFTLAPAQVARIDSVYALIQYGPFQAPENDVWVLRLCAQNGEVLFAQPSPPVPASSVGTLEITWVRQGNDSAQFPLFTYTGVDAETIAGWGVVPIPSIVLSGSAFVTLQGYRGGSAQAVSGAVQTVTVSYTPAGGTTSGTTSADVFPLLLPLATS